MNTRVGIAMAVALVTTMLLLAATAPYSMPGTNSIPAIIPSLLAF